MKVWRNDQGNDSFAFLAESVKEISGLDCRCDTLFTNLKKKTHCSLTHTRHLLGRLLSFESDCILFL